MRIKLDENLPVDLAVALTSAGHDVDTSVEEGLAGKPDDVVWSAACRASRFFITQDLDFSDARKFAPGTHPGIMLVRLKNPSRTRLVERVKRSLEADDWSQWTACLVVITERKTRVRRPPA